MTEMSLDIAAIREAVIEKAVTQVLDDYEWKASFNARIEKHIDTVFRDKAAHLIEDAANAAVVDGFNREYQRHDNFGSAVGDKTSIRKELDRMIGDYWTTMVDKTGRPTNTTYSAQTRAEYVMMRICGDGFTEQVKAQAVTVAARMKDGLREQLRTHIDRMMGELFHVQTHVDKAEGRSK